MHEARKLNYQTYVHRQLKTISAKKTYQFKIMSYQLAGSKNKGDNTRDSKFVEQM